MRSAFCALAALGLLSASLFAEENEAPNSTDSEVYKLQPGQAPPVAPPLKKGSPLDHLANDPKYTQLAPGYHEGNTQGNDYWIAHRLIDPDGGQGWGWVRLAVAPHRHLQHADEDLDWEFKFWGKFATYKAYDPRLDEQLPVFILEGYQVIGPKSPLSIKVGPAGRIQHLPSGASSRDNRPILSDPGVD
jgi:hypothetical protein